MAGPRFLLAINLFNYIDRQVLAGVVRKIQAEFNISDGQAGLLAPAFLVSYMLTRRSSAGWPTATTAGCWWGQGLCCGASLPAHRDWQPCSGDA